MKAIPCEVYSRIVGYFRPVRQWNKGKQVEFADRVVYIAKEEQNDIASQTGGTGMGAAEGQETGE